MNRYFIRVYKLLVTVKNRKLISIFIRHRVIGTHEHNFIMKDLSPSLIVDVGANYGQFSLFALSKWPKSQIIAFEPIPECALKMKEIFSNVSAISYHVVALSDINGVSKFHLSKSLDSSSILEITELQNRIYQKTSEEKQISVNVATLSTILENEYLPLDALLKIDVQGNEYKVLKGAQELLNRFEHIFVELSFLELYVGQKLAGDVINFLAIQGFQLKQIGNTHYKKSIGMIQADFLFKRV